MNSTSTNRILIPAVIVAASALLTGCAGSTSSAASDTPAGSASPSTGGCLRDDGGCLGVLSPGTYSSAAFTAFGESSPGQLTYTVSDGSWANALDHIPAYWFQPAKPYAAGTGDDFLPGVYVWGDVAPAAQVFPGCPEAPDTSAPTDAAGLLAWLQALPGLVVTPVPDIQIVDMTAKGFDVVIDAATAPKCSWGPFVPLLANRVGAPDAYMTGVGAGEEMQVFLFDLGGGHTAAIVFDGPATDFESRLPAERELVSTFAFNAP